MGLDDDARLAAREGIEDHVDRQRVERPLVQLGHGAAHLARVRGLGLGMRRVGARLRVGVRARVRVGGWD